MITRFCKTYIKTIAKYIQVPPILNLLYSSFSTAWGIYLTARIISTFISISIFQKNCHFVSVRKSDLTKYTVITPRPRHFIASLGLR